MRGGYELSLQQNQQLVMTQELQQALAILQMTALELKQHLEEALLQNPVLEELESETSPDVDGDELPEWTEYFSDASDLGLPPQKSDDRPRDWTSDATSLYEHLSHQMVFEDFSVQDEMIAHFILGCLNDDGFLQGEPAELSRAAGIEHEDFLRVWEVIRNWEPAGIAARDLADCLKLQLSRLGCQEELLYRLVDDYLPELMAAKFKLLAGVLDCSLRQLQQAAEFIGRLNPRPGSAMIRQPVNYVTPDVSVERMGEEYAVIVHESYLPSLGLNRYYLQLLKTTPDLPTKRFLRQKLKQGMWLLRSVEQRKLTLYRVVSCLVDRQKDFFREGARALHPLTLKQVADEMGVHESTVSRTVAGKYVNTPHGLFSLSFFFPSTLGRGVSSETARVAMRELISQEDAKEPLSDSAISQYLRQEGIALSRRTVAKYRHTLGIPAVHLRRRY